MDINKSEILTALKTLGLNSGAEPDEVHAAFRKLARELHPDITGSKSDFRFKQITGAYNILKNLTAEELNVNINSSPEKNLYDYYNAEKKRRADDEKIDSILEKYENEIKNNYSNFTGNENNIEIEAVIFRLKSKKTKVINAALKYSGHLVNRVEFRKAFTEILKRPDFEIDETTANIVESLPFDNMTRKLIAMDSAENAKNFPTGLIITLIGGEPDVNVMESFLTHVKPDDVAVILRRWPSGKIMSQNVIRKLLESDDARILVPILGAIRTYFPGAAKQNKKRLTELENHTSGAVRAWAKKLL